MNASIPIPNDESSVSDAGNDSSGSKDNEVEIKETVTDEQNVEMDSLSNAKKRTADSEKKINYRNKKKTAKHQKENERISGKEKVNRNSRRHNNKRKDKSLVEGDVVSELHSYKIKYIMFLLNEFIYLILYHNY